MNFLQEREEHDEEVFHPSAPSEWSEKLKYNMPLLLYLRISFNISSKVLRHDVLLHPALQEKREKGKGEDADRILSPLFGLFF